MADGQGRVTRGRRDVRGLYQVICFLHVCSLESGYDGNVDVGFTDCVDETLSNRVATDNPTCLSARKENDMSGCGYQRY